MKTKEEIEEELAIVKFNLECGLLPISSVFYHEGWRDALKWVLENEDLDKLIEKATKILNSDKWLKLAEKLERENRLTDEDLRVTFRW